jgi:hypothetical protein
MSKRVKKRPLEQTYKLSVNRKEKNAYGVLKREGIRVKTNQQLIVILRNNPEEP